jgi:hypothetical protein
MMMCPPTPRETVGAALLAAGQDMASYQPPRLLARPAFLGGCSPGWIAEAIPGGCVIVAYRPPGILSAEDSAAIQRERLTKWQREIFPAPAWETLWSRRAETPALLVRKVEAT